MLVPPRLDGWLGLPSSLIGRPSVDLATRPNPTPPACGMAVAKNSGTPGSTPAGWRTYGTTLRADAGLSDGLQPVARATDAPIRPIAVRRLTGSSHSAASAGNSSRIISRKAGLSIHWSMDCHCSGIAECGFRIAESDALGFDIRGSRSASV